MALSYTAAASWTTGGTDSGSQCYKDVTVTVANGDLLVAVGLAEHFDGGSGTRDVATQSGSTGTWTLGSPSPTLDNDCDAIAGWAVASASGSVTVRVSVRVTVATLHMGAAVFVIPAAEWSGTPTFTTFQADADGQVSVTLAGTSTVIFAGADWSATAPGTTNTPTGSTNHATVTDTGRYAAAVRSWGSQGAGTRNYGPSGLSGVDYTGAIIAVPVASGGAFTGTAARTSTATVTAAGGVTASTGASRSSTASITAAGVVAVVAAASLAVTATITAGGSVTSGVQSGASLTATATRTAAGVVSASTGATQSTTATITPKSLGLTGLIGAGRTELCHTLFGMTLADRGRIVLTRDPDGEERCVACNLCAVACPVGCISLQKAEHEDGRWYPEFFRINFSRCIFCGMCEEACPTTAIHFGSASDLASGFGTIMTALGTSSAPCTLMTSGPCGP